MSTRRIKTKTPVSKHQLVGSRLPLEQLESRVLLDGAPTATLYAGPVDTWGPTYTFKVAYSSDKRIHPSTIDSSDILVTGPNGYSRLARLVSMVDELPHHRAL